MSVCFSLYSLKVYFNTIEELVYWLKELGYLEEGGSKITEKYQFM